MQKCEKDFGIRIMKKRIDEDQTVYAFSYETTSVNINDALCDLQKILPEWEAVIIQEIAYEQSLNGMMRYVIGKAIIITYNTVDTLDLSMLVPCGSIPAYFDIYHYCPYKGRQTYSQAR